LGGARARRTFAHLEVIIVKLFVLLEVLLQLRPPLKASHRYVDQSHNQGSYVRAAPRKENLCTSHTAPQEESDRTGIIIYLESLTMGSLKKPVASSVPPLSAQARSMARMASASIDRVST
jgi:hypothetical protein